MYNKKHAVVTVLINFQDDLFKMKWSLFSVNNFFFPYNKYKVINYTGSIKKLTNVYIN